MDADYLHLQCTVDADGRQSGTRYGRLSKLVVMLAMAADTRRLLVRKTELRLREVLTTAFTDRPASMKHRGVMELAKRGETAQGEKFLN